MKNKTIIKWVLILGCIILVLGMGALKVKTSLANLNTPTPDSHQLIALEMIQSAQSDLTQIPNDRQVMEPQLTYDVRFATEMALNKSKPKPIITASTPIPKIFPTMEPHIWEETGSAVVHDAIENWFSGGFNGQDYTVYAGADSVDPSQGVLDIHVISQNFVRAKWVRYLTPMKSGSVRIQSWVGPRLILSTKSGETLYFDLAAEQFVSSLTVIVPTFPPLPKNNPTIAPTFPIYPTVNPYP
jgi:hypothetical protein